MTTHSSSFDELHATDGIRRRPAANVKANDPTNATPGGKDKDEKRDEAPRTTELVLGRTPDGQLFRVVETRDMVKSVFHPQHPKTLLDLVLLGLLLFQVFLYCILTREQAQIFFLVYFAIWRITYNGGLGYILTKQSQTRWIVRFVERRGWLDAKKAPRMHAWIHSFYKTKLGAAYDMTCMPNEFNVWILFRSLVDVILLNDVTAYALFSLSHVQGLGNYGVLLFVVRWCIGLLLLAFNAWVKLDAHRVVKDYAWYWGDCFFLCLQNLKFDGVYEVAPDPMYSIGYIGYYGLSLLTGSYMVFFVSLAAHALQLLFLVAFENPHMDRVYGERVPIAARVSEQEHSTKATPPDAPRTNAHDLHHRLFHGDNVIFSHMDLFRSSDFLLVLCVAYAVAPVVLVHCSHTTLLVISVAHALAWRLFHSFGLGLALRWQSEQRWVVHHFLKHYHFEDGDAAVKEAFTNWKAIYNTSLIMTYTSFALMSLCSYMTWTDELYKLRYVLGVLLILLHMWSARSSYRVLGPFGWLYGDFFIDAYPKRLSYTGIYRFLNNPERSMGSAAIFGMALLSGSLSAIVVAAISHMSHWWFLSCVEGPHMRRVYGADVRKDSGVTKQLKQLGRSQWLSVAQPSVHELENALKKAQGLMGQFFDKSRPHMEHIVDQARTLLQQKTEHILTMRTGDSVRDIDQAKYHVSPIASKHTKEQRFHIGEPIVTQWAAAHNHSRRDWIGIYPVEALDTDERHGHMLVTRTRSRGKWLGIAEAEWDGPVHLGTEQGSLGTKGVSNVDMDKRQVHGVSVFQGSRLPWTPGTYEMRYHHDNTHDVLARSERFTIYVDTPADPMSFDETYMILAKIVRFALVDSSPAIDAYESADKDDLTLWTQDQAKNIAEGIKQAFHVDFSKDVIVACANTTILTKDILTARALLAR